MLTKFRLENLLRKYSLGYFGVGGRIIKRNIVAEWLTLLLRILEVPGSNIGHSLGPDLKPGPSE
jgi:hypothetical protein